MPRAARIVFPEIAHHVTQRGNRQQELFLQPGDWAMYRDLAANAFERHGVTCLAWCFMPNHVHLVLVPQTADGLRAALASVHTAYSQRINLRERVSGHLFQGRFASYAMDDAHLLAAIRYVENNPVKAKLVERAVDWRWSSARAHSFGHADGLTAPSELLVQYPDWTAVLEQGWEAGGEEAVEAALVSGKPQGQQDWLAALGHSMAARPRGRPRRAQS